jgi:glycogen debranching enzyme
MPYFLVMTLVEEAIPRAKETLMFCSTPDGMFASGGKGGYDSIFARDSMIGLIGASCYDWKHEFRIQFATTLNTLAKHQSKHGQIPNAVDLFSERPDQVTFATIDSSLWYLLGLQYYKYNYKDRRLFTRHRKKVKKTFAWIGCQDAGEDGLPEQLPTSDWQDAFPHKYGHTINTISLYYANLRLYGKEGAMHDVLEAISGKNQSKIQMFNKKKGYFFPWVWKNHDGDIEQEEWFDSLGNLLAICSGLAKPRQANSILDFVKSRRVARPYPIRAIYPPMKRGDKEWHSYFERCLAKKPHWYLNGGIWPYIGGFYVAALVKAGRFEEAREELNLLAEVNKIGAEKDWEFNEWVHPIKKKAMGSSYHAWSAGAFLFALSALELKQLPLLG